MMSLGVSKGGVIPPTDEDRRRIIKQMKVRTTLRGDKSWIQHHNSDSEDEKKSSPLSGRAGGASPAPKPPAPQNDRSPVSKPQSGYLIRGVFTRTIDKTSSVPDSSSPSAAQKSSSTKGQSPGRSPSGYRMTTEDYKKLAPYNVRQKAGDGDEEDVPFSPDEHKKRTEAANSVLRRSAGRERAYVLSAAKKSNGSPTQEFPPLFAKRIEIEEEEGQQRRSASMAGSRRFPPGDSSANGLGKTTPGSSWDEPKTAAASPSSPTTGSRSQTSTSLRETSEGISTSAGIRNGEDSQALNGNPALGAVSKRGHGCASKAGNVPKVPSQAGAKSGVLEESEKAPKEKPELSPWDEQGPRDTEASPNGSHPEHAEASNGLYPPRSSLDSRDRPVDAADKLLHQYQPSPSLDDGRSSLQPDVPFPPTEGAPVHTEEAEYSFKRSILGSEERSNSMSPEGPAQLQPHWKDLMFSGSTSLTERGQGPPGHGAPPELPRAQEPTAHEPGVGGSQDSTGGSRDTDKEMSFRVQSEEFTARRSSSGIPAPEAPRANESEPHRDRITPAYEDQTTATTEGHHESPGPWRHSEPGPVPASRSDFTSREDVLSAQQTQNPVPLYQEPQPFIGSAPSHRIPAYVDSQVFSSMRPSADSEGRVSGGSSSPRSSRHDGAGGHGGFTPQPGRHDSLPRDPTMSMSQRSHRVPFYMDSLNYNSTRLLSGSSERLCSPHSSPAASGYQPDSSTAGRGILFVKEYVNTGGFSASPRYGSLVDLSDLDRARYNHHSYLSSTPLLRPSEPVCTYCSREIRDCPKIILEHLNIHCHEYCFRCGICHKAMGDLLDKIFIHRDIVHCDKCYEKLF